MSFANPTIGLTIQAPERGIDNGVILALLDGHFIEIEVHSVEDKAMATQTGGEPIDPKSIADLVRRTLASETTKGIMIQEDDQLIRKCLTQLGGAFDTIGGQPFYVYDNRIYPVFYPISLIDRRTNAHP